MFVEVVTEVRARLTVGALFGEPMNRILFILRTKDGLELLL